MSETNGHTQTLPQLREQIETLRAQRELDTLRLENAVSRQLMENVYHGYSSNQWGELVDPMDAYRDADLRVTPMGSASRHDRRDGANRPFIWHEIDLDFMRAQARWLATKNMLGVGAVERLADYTVRTGFKYEARPGRRFRHDRVAAELAAQVEEVLEEFQSFNLIETGGEQYTWAMRERDVVVKSVTDGDAILRCFDAGDDGLTLVRFVEPEQLRQPLGSPPGYTYGILTKDGDVETPLEYAVCYDHPDNYECVSASDISHLKLNVPSCVKRGLSDFYPGAEMFDNLHKMIRNMVVTGSVQAAIAWIEQFSAATPAAISSHIAAVRDQNRPDFTRPFTGKTVNYQKMEPGSIPKVASGREYVPQPTATNAGSHTTTVQAGMRALGARWSMPEYMISGDASNANYSSTLVSGSPFVVRIECQQHLRYAPFFVRLMWQGPIRNAARAGRFKVNGRRYTIEEISRMIDVLATPPQVAISDPTREATMDHQDIAAGVMSLQTRRARRGLDDETERRNLKEEPLPSQQGQGGEQQASGEGGLQALLGESRLSESALMEVAEWLSAIEEGKRREDGETWETNGRKYKREGGKTVRVATTREEQQERNAKAADQTHEIVKKFQAEGKVNAQSAHELAGHILKLTGDQARELKQRLGLKASGSKYDVASKLAARALAKAKAPAKPQEKPEAEKPSATTAPSADELVSKLKRYDHDSYEAPFNEIDEMPGYTLDLEKDELKKRFASAPVAEVSLDDLIATQGMVYDANLRHALSGGAAESLPQVVKQGGKFYLDDGTHRATAAKLQGAKKLKVKLLDLDAPAKPEPQPSASPAAAAPDAGARGEAAQAGVAKPAQKQPKPAKTPREKPAPKPAKPADISKPAVQAQAEKAFTGAWQKAEQRFRRDSVLPKIPDIYDDLKAEMPELTEKDFHSLLKKWQSEDRIVLSVANDPHFEPQSHRGIDDARGKLLYVEVKPGHFGASK